jgi:hypothetical protein
MPESPEFRHSHRQVPHQRGQLRRRDEREKASQRSRDALERKARHGYNTGGEVYGYDNAPVYGTNTRGESVKAYTDYRINEEQAEVVRAIYTIYADGYGHRAIAKTLNADPAYRAARFLLTGLARCAIYGDTMIVSGHPFGNGRTRRSVPHCVNGYRHDWGKTVCTDDHEVRIEMMDAPILRSVGELLWPEAVDEIFDVAVRHLQGIRREGPDKVEVLLTEKKRLTVELKNLNKPRHRRQGAEEHQGRNCGSGEPSRNN